MDSPASPLDFSQSKINQNLTAEQKIDLFRDMARIRRFEQTALKFYNGGKMGGFLHLYIGQESVAVGTISTISAVRFPEKLASTDMVVLLTSLPRRTTLS